MFYGILTTPGVGGMPFNYTDTPQTAPGDPLRVPKSATLVGFKYQPDREFASNYAAAASKILWYVTADILHPDDLQAGESFNSCSEFENWLREREKE